jgi:hypothetical protein
MIGVMMPRSNSPSTISIAGLGLCCAALLALGATSPLRAQTADSGDPAGELLLISNENPSKEWREAKYNVGFTMLIIDDQSKESGPGFEISGPDPFRDLYDREKKLVPTWRLGVNFFDFNDPGTGAATKINVFTAAVGYDYYFHRSKELNVEGEEVRKGSPFLSSFITYYAQDRSGGNPLRKASNFGALNLGIGWAKQRFRFRYDHSFLEGGGQSANTFGISYTF